MRKELVINGQNIEFEIHSISDKNLELKFAEEKYNIKRLYQKGNCLYMEINGKVAKVILGSNKIFYVDIGLDSFQLQKKTKKRMKRSNDDEHSMLTPMPGKVLKVLVEVGQEVKVGDPLVVMEAMKMEHTLVSNKESIVAEILFREGQLVEEGVDLIHLRDKHAAS